MKRVCISDCYKYSLFKILKVFVWQRIFDATYMCPRRKQEAGVGCLNQIFSNENVHAQKKDISNCWRCYRCITSIASLLFWIDSRTSIYIYIYMCSKWSYMRSLVAFILLSTSQYLKQLWHELVQWHFTVIFASF